MKIINKEAALNTAAYLKDWQKQIDILQEELDEKGLSVNYESLPAKSLKGLNAIAASAILALDHDDEEACIKCVEYILMTEKADAIEQLEYHELDIDKDSETKIKKVLSTHIFLDACLACGKDPIKELRD